MGFDPDGAEMQTHLDYVRATMGQSKIIVFRAVFDGDEARAQEANQRFETAFDARGVAGRDRGAAGRRDRARRVPGARRADLPHDRLLRGDPRAAHGRPRLARPRRPLAQPRRRRAGPSVPRSDPDRAHAPRGRRGPGGRGGGGHDERPRSPALRPARRSWPGCSPARTTAAQLESAPHTHILESIADLPAAVFTDRLRTLGRPRRRTVETGQRGGGGSRCRGRATERPGTLASSSARRSSSSASRSGAAASAATSDSFINPPCASSVTMLRSLKPVAVLGIGRDQVALRVRVPRHEPRDAMPEQRRDRRRAGLGVAVGLVGAQDPADVVHEPRELQLAIVGVTLARAGPRTAASGRARRRLPRRRARCHASSSASSSSVSTYARRFEVARLHDLALLDLEHPGRALLDAVVVERHAALREVVHQVADDVAVAAERDRLRRLLDELERVGPVVALTELLVDLDLDAECRGERLDGLDAARVRAREHAGDVGVREQLARGRRPGAARCARRDGGCRRLRSGDDFPPSRAARRTHPSRATG